MIKKCRRLQEVCRRFFTDLLQRNRSSNNRLRALQEVAGGFYYLRVRASPSSRIYISIGENLPRPPANGRFPFLSDERPSGCACRRFAGPRPKPPADLLRPPACPSPAEPARAIGRLRSCRPAFRSIDLPRVNLSATEVCHVQDPLGTGWPGDPDRARGDRRLVDSQRLGGAAVVVVGARGAAVSALAGGARRRHRALLGGKKPGRLHIGWATPRKPPGQRGGRNLQSPYVSPPMRPRGWGGVEGEVPRAVRAVSRSAALGMPQDRLTTSIAGAVVRYKPLTPSLGGDRVALAAGGAGAHVRAAWGQPDSNAGRHEDRPCPCQMRVTSVPASEAVCNMCRQGESTSLSGVRVTFRLGTKRDSQRDNARLVNITPGRGAIV